MGDTGSLMLGASLAVFSLILKKELLLIIIGGMFVLETLSRNDSGFPFQKNGKAASSRWLPFIIISNLLGWAENKVVTRFWIMGGMFAVMGPFDS